MVAAQPIACWLYVSLASDKLVVDTIVSASRLKNVTLEVSGALMFSGRRFAEYIEGPVPSVERLRASIMADSRHSNVVTLNEGITPRRSFADWSLAYSGEAEPFDKLISLAYRLEGRAAETLLMEMIRRFTRDARKRPGEQ